MTKHLSLIALLALAACQNQGLNPEALDLNRYVTNLSESQHKFPAYVALMTADKCKPLESANGASLYPTVPCEVKKIADFFADRRHPKQLFLIGQRGIEADVRVYALAKHDPNLRVIQINLDTLRKDAEAQAWGDGEYNQILKAVLAKNNSENTIFLLSEPIAQISSYSSIVKPFTASQQPVFEKSSKAQKAMPLGEIPLQELTAYLKGIMSYNVNRAEEIALLTYAYIPTASALDVVSSLEVSENSVEAVYQEFLRQNQLPAGDNLTAVMESMRDLLKNPNSAELADLNRKLFRDRLNLKADMNLEQMSKVSKSFKDKYELERKLYCLNVLKYANANAIPDSMRYLLEDCEK
jgi:hypothetical protein